MSSLATTKNNDNLTHANSSRFFNLLHWWNTCLNSRHSRVTCYTHKHLSNYILFKKKNCLYFLSIFLNRTQKKCLLFSYSLHNNQQQLANDCGCYYSHSNNYECMGNHKVIHLLSLTLIINFSSLHLITFQIQFKLKKRKIKWSPCYLCL